MPELHRDNRIISFDFANPNALTKMLPEDAWQIVKGKLYTHFTLDLSKLLTQLGIDMPGWEVIRHRYKFPKVQKLYDMYQHQIDTAAFLTTHRRAFCLNSPRTGKAQKLDAPVLTPNGWAQMGAIKIGDYVVGKDGAACRVTGITPYDALDVYRVTFRDGSEVECSAGHVWSVHSRGWGRGRETELRQKTTAELLDYGVWKAERHAGNQYADGKARTVKRMLHAVPTVSPVEFPPRFLAVEPYTLGALLGDGGLTGQSSVRITLHESFDISKLKLPQHCVLRKAEQLAKCAEYRIIGSAQGHNPMLDKLRELKLQGCSSLTKFIPSDYLLASVEQRQALFQGLMDTDGHKTKTYYDYSTSSERLAEDVKHLAKSLGHYVSMSEKTPYFTYKGVRKQGQLSYRLRIQFTRKKVAITNIEKTGEVAPMQCLTVEGGHYITNNFTVTHNSAAAAAAADFLINMGQTKQVLIITPTSCIFSVWEQEIQGLFVNRQAMPVVGTKVQRLKKLKKDCDFYVINPDGISRVEDLRKAIAAKIKSGKINAIILDESTEYGNADSSRWKALKPLADKVDYLWMLTGTPGDPMTVYGQAKLMDTNSVPPEQSIWQAMTMYPAMTFEVGKPGKKRNVTKWLPNASSKDHIYRVLSPAIRIRKEDVLKDIPEAIKIPRYGVMSTKQKHLYDTLQKQRVVRVNGDTIQADNAAQLANMLMQISSGTLKFRTPEGENKTIRIPMQEKLDLLLQTVFETPNKKLVYANNIATVELLHDFLNSKGATAEIVNGSVTGRKRADRFKRFMDDEDPRVLCCHFMTTSFGVELGKADSVIWFGVPFASAVLYQQVNERLLSSKQLSNTPAVVQIYSTPQEKQSFKALDNGVDWQQSVSDLFRF